MDFREIDKESLQVLVPPQIMDEVRIRASRERKSLSAVTTELLCSALNRDARVYGITPGKRQIAGQTAVA